MCVFFFIGPFAVNGVPLRRVGQQYVLITSTRIDFGSPKDISGLEQINDDYFKRTKSSDDDEKKEDKVSVKP